MLISNLRITLSNSVTTKFKFKIKHTKLKIKVEYFLIININKRIYQNLVHSIIKYLLNVVVLVLLSLKIHILSIILSFSLLKITIFN